MVDTFGVVKLRLFTHSLDRFTSECLQLLFSVIKLHFNKFYSRKFYDCCKVGKMIGFAIVK